jgi:channel protein (hemolysin III family)
VVGSAILVGIAALTADRPVFYASVVYCFCLLTMLACSAAYNLVSNASRRGFLRQFDHAAIFLMIAGTYTPFDMSTARCLGDRYDRCRLDGSRHGSGDEADLPT